MVKLHPALFALVALLALAFPSTSHAETSELPRLCNVGKESCFKTGIRALTFGEIAEIQAQKYPGFTAEDLLIHNKWVKFASVKAPKKTNFAFSAPNGGRFTLASTN